MFRNVTNLLLIMPNQRRLSHASWRRHWAEFTSVCHTELVAFKDLGYLPFSRNGGQL